MTQEAHTREPWACPVDDEGNVAVVAEGGYLVTFAFPNGDAADKANARRIVACVNALAGIPIEAIESGVVAEFVEAARGLKADLLERAEWDGDVRVVCAGAGAWARFCNALAKLENTHD